MKAYPAYKDLGLSWLKSIPEKWDVKKIKYLGELKSGSGFPDAEQGITDAAIPFFKVSDMNLADNSVFMQAFTNTVTLETVKSLGAKIIEKGSILFPKVGAALLTNKRRIVTMPCCADNNVMALTPYDHSYNKFLYYALLIKDFGVIANPGAVPSINASQVAEIQIAFPPLLEQQAIAEFLDRRTAQIDTLIAKKQRQIDLLQEQRTALINETMSNGQERKYIFQGNSPAPWLFALPPRWRRQQLKFNTYMKGRIGYQNLRSEEYTEEGPYLVSSVHFKDGHIEWDKCNHVTRERFEMAPEIILQEHDVLFMKDGALMGKLAFVNELPGDACLNSHLLLMRPLNGSYLPRYLFYVLMTDIFEAYMIQERNGTTFFGFSQLSMGNFPISLPPMDEQKDICHFLDAQTEKIKIALEKINSNIAGLQEYRTALISEAVTGKIDVRITG